jgi:molybdate transport system ATP-binding protein
VAELAGVNRFSGRAGADGVVAVDGGGVLHVPGAPAGPVDLVVHPRACALHRTDPGGSPRNRWPARVAAVERTLEGRARVQLSGPPDLVAEVTAAAAAELHLAPGEEVWVAVKSTEIGLA